MLIRRKDRQHTNKVLAQKYRKEPVWIQDEDTARQKALAWRFETKRSHRRRKVSKTQKLVK